MRADFCVYIHRRLASGAPFYIGKGYRKRVRERHNRNRHWRNIVAKDGGFTTTLLADNVDEDFAFLIETEAISVFRKRGCALVNMTDGGEGVSGLSRPDVSARMLGNSINTGRKQPPEERAMRSAALKGKKKSPEHAARIALALTGKKASPETRLKLSLSHRGQRRPLSKETRAKISAAQKGRRLSEEQKAHLSRINKGKTPSAETKLRLSLAMKGRRLSAERRAQMVEVWKRRRQCALDL